MSFNWATAGGGDVPYSSGNVISTMSGTFSMSGQPHPATSGGTLPVSVVSGSIILTTSRPTNIKDLPAASGGSTASGSSLGILAVIEGPFTYKNATGAAITNIYQSGSVLLHSININQYGASGSQVQVRDSSSGVAGTLVGTIAGNSGIATIGTPGSLYYDVVFVTGLVTSTSGAAWDLTITYKVL